MVGRFLGASCSFGPAFGVNGQHFWRMFVLVERDHVVVLRHSVPVEQQSAGLMTNRCPSSRIGCRYRAFCKTRILEGR